jgi:hypothetical protein
MYMAIPTAIRSLLAALAVALLVALYLVHATLGWVTLGMVGITAVTRFRRAAAAAKAIVPRGAFM